VVKFTQYTFAKPSFSVLLNIRNRSFRQH